MGLQGTVIECHGRNILVEVVPRAECQGCSACKGLLADGEGPATRQITVLAGEFAPAPGDQVRLDTPPGRGTAAALLLFGLPLLWFFLGLLFGPGLFEWVMGSSVEIRELTALACGIVGLVLAFVTLTLLNRFGFLLNLNLEVVAILSPSVSHDLNGTNPEDMDRDRTSSPSAP
jgi:positive regulator of sigma E activity